MSVFIHVTHITGAKPTFAQAVGSFLWAVQVAFHDLWAFYPNFTAFAGGHNVVRCFEIVNRDFCTGYDLADRAGLINILHGVTGGDRCGLAQTVAFDQPASCQALKSFFDFKR